MEGEAMSCIAGVDIVSDGLGSGGMSWCFGVVFVWRLGYVGCWGGAGRCWSGKWLLMVVWGANSE